MKRLSAAVLAALSTIGCGDIVLNAVDPPTGSTGSTSTGAGAGAGMPSGDPTALAMNGSDFAPNSIQWNGTGFAPWDRPDSLVLLMDSGARDCSAPVYSIDCDGQSRWQTILTIPKELNYPGKIDLPDWRIGAYELMMDANCGRALGSGNGFWGTLEIKQSTPNQVTFTLSDSGGSGHPPANGDYVANRCSPPPPAAPPQAAIAMLGSKLPPGPGAPSNIDPTALYVFLGNPQETCSTPWPALGCDGKARMQFMLPASLQVPGQIDLFNPQIDASYAIGTKDISQTCVTDTGPFHSSGPFPNGYIDISSIDAQSIAFSVYRSYSFTTNQATIELDGHYAATFCP